jgi:hypothetical protein
MKFRLNNRDAVVNNYLYDALNNNRVSCRSCILNGCSEFSKRFYNLLEEKNISMTGPCSAFNDVLEKLGYKSSITNTGCLARQHQALAVYLLLSKPKEKRK